MRRERFDLPALRAYGAAVHETVDAWLPGLDTEAPRKPVDLSGIGLGMSTAGFVLLNAVIGRLSSHAGEIAALKGIQGLPGYPI